MRRPAGQPLRSYETVTKLATHSKSQHYGHSELLIKRVIGVANQSLREAASSCVYISSYPWAFNSHFLLLVFVKPESTRMGTDERDVSQHCLHNRAVAITTTASSSGETVQPCTNQDQSEQRAGSRASVMGLRASSVDDACSSVTAVQ